MTAIVTPDEMRAAEQTAVDAGRSEPDLMRDAAGQVAPWLDARIRATDGQARRATALVGPGNNGGDALVALSLLVERGWQCRAIYIGRERRGELPASASSLDQIEIVDEPGMIADSDVILDGIYGTGGQARLNEWDAEVIAAARTVRQRDRTPLVTIDAPTGVDSLTGEAHEEAFPADVTLCIGFPKVGLVREPAATFAGEMIVLDIGLDAPKTFSGPRLIDIDTVRETLPRRTASAHKANAGGLLIIGGAPMYYGAPRLSAEAALRAGAGLVALSVPRSIVPAIAAQVPEVIYHPINDADARRAVREIQDLVGRDESRYTAAVVGPGIGRDEVTDTLLSGLFGVSVAASTGVGFQIPDAVEHRAAGQSPAQTFVQQPVVIDADALNWLAERERWPELLQGLSVILTPHPGEMARLLGDGTTASDIVADPHTVAARAAADWQLIVILKGGYTCLALPDGSVWLAPRASSELATAGTGDVLSGLLGGLLAQGMAPAEAARAAIYLGSMAGWRAKENLGTLSVIARDVVQYMPGVLHDIQSAQWSR